MNNRLDIAIVCLKREIAAPEALPVPLATKTCTKCSQTKPLSEFHRHTRDGRSQPCKKCKKCKTKKRAQADRDALKRWKKTPSGKESIRRSQRKYETAHHRERRAYHDEYYSLHPEKKREHYTKWNKKQQHMRRLTKAFVVITQEALNGLQNSDQ